MEHAVELFNKEIAYYLCDGFSVNTSWYGASMHIRGIFDSPTEGFDPEKHSVLVEFHHGAELRKELAAVSVSILGKAGASFFITQVTDIHISSVNDVLTPGRNMKITGNKFKPAGKDAACGVYFVNADIQEQVKVKEADIVENQNAHLLLIIPALAAGTYHLEITTQFTGGSAFLK
ncbi:MAG: DUF4469 domain-containing protein [Treponema sp.]|jgi:hypothetical protein|nr:DUF4469 domain-containing protein [Treponema sp.]